MTVRQLKNRLVKFNDDEKIVFTEHDGKQYKDIIVFGGEENNPDGTCMMSCVTPVGDTQYGSSRTASSLKG